MNRRVVGAAALLAAVALSVGLASAPWAGDAPQARPESGGGAASTPGIAAPSPGAATPAGRQEREFSPTERALLREAERQEEQRLLREQLGGLAALALDPLPPELAACVPGRQPFAGEVREPGQVAATLADLRGLDLGEPVPAEFLLPDEMAERVESAFSGRDDAEALDTERRVLAALGAVPPGIDMRRVRVEAFAEHVSGLFSGAREEVLVRATDPARLSALERTVLAHEYEHALTFEHLGRPSQARDGPEDADERRASQAVVEGSATLAMLQFAHTALDTAERLELRRDLLARAREGVLDVYTPYLVAELQYPYTEGLALACARYAEGGWAAVDADYADPPDSSLEVLAPGAFPGGAEPVAAPGMGRPEGQWRRITADAFGAADLLWLLEAPGGDAGAAVDGARERVTGWQGGRLVAWADGDRTVVGLSLAQRPGAPPLCETVLAWQSATLGAEASSDATGAHVVAGDDRVAAASCHDGGVVVGIAEDRGDAVAVAGG